MHHLVVRLLELHLSSEELEFPVALRLNSVNLLFFSGFPNLIKILEELIHQGWGNLARALVSKVVCHFKSVFWDPIFHFFRLFQAF